jgi:hypothetical protein
MPQASIVRIANPGDWQEIWRLILNGHNENGMFRLAPNKIAWYMNRALAPQNIPFGDLGPRVNIGVIGRPGQLEGLVIVAIGEYWYSDQKHIEEFGVYVDPEHRRSEHAIAMISWMKTQVDETGMPLITGIISNHRTEAKCRLYRRYLPKVGEFFCVMPKGSVLAGPGS